jgi:transposase
MNTIFEAALSINKPWYIKDFEFDPDKKRLDLYVDFRKGSTFQVDEPGYDGFYKVYDTVDKTWRHLNFFQHESYLHCRTPRIKYDKDKIKQIDPPWAGKSPGFTLLFEVLVMQLCAHMPVNTVCSVINENKNKIWRMLDRYVDMAREHENFSDMTAVGMDETSRAKGHDYVTLFVDLKERRTTFVAEGKDHATVEAFADDLKAHNGSPDQISDVSCDMSPAFIKGVRETLPGAKITFDKFHVLKLINEAVDQVRREEAATQPLLKKARYIFLKNERNLTKGQRETLEKLQLPRLRIKSVRALRVRESFQDIYQADTEDAFSLLLNKWYFWATHSRLKPIIKVAKTIKAHWDGILEWKRSYINNGILEGLNSIVQAAKAKARGFSTFKNFRIIIFLTTGKLKFNLVNQYVG